MTDRVLAIHRALRKEASYYGTDSSGNEWRFVVDDEYGEVWGYREVRCFSSDLKEASVAIAALLRGQTPEGKY